MKRVLKYLIAVIVVGIIGYNSVYIKKLSEVKASTLSTKINTTAYTRNFWDNKLMPSLGKAIEINELISLLKTDPQKTFKIYSHTLVIGNLQYFMVKGEGQIKKINENDVLVLSVFGDKNQELRIATEFVYGNAVRDASGLLNMNEFDNTSDFNEVSANINKIIRAEVLPPFKQKAATDANVQFVGAIELNQKFLDLNDIEVTPVQLKLVK